MTCGLGLRYHGWLRRIRDPLAAASAGDVSSMSAGFIRHECSEEGLSASVAVCPFTLDGDLGIGVRQSSADLTPLRGSVAALDTD